PSEEGGLPSASPAPSETPPAMAMTSNGTPIRLKFSDLEKKKPLSHSKRAAGETLSAHATIYVTSHAAEPLIVERWPDGARAAVVFTDHADRTDPLVLRALLYGSSDPKQPGYGSQGFFGHGLKITKSFFARAWKGGLATDHEAQK